MNPNDFSAAMREAEAEAGIEADPHPFLGYQGVQAAEPAAATDEPAAEPADTAEAGQPRGDDGKFSSDTTDDTSTETAETVEGQPERLYAGRYKTVDELERAIQEKEDFIARQGTDVGTLRQQVDQLSALIQQQQQAAQAPAAVADIENAIYEQPQQAANLVQGALQRAVQTGDFASYDRAVAAWEDVDRPSAKVFDRQVQAWLTRNAILQEINPQIQPGAQLAQQNELERAIQQTAAKHQDFADVVGPLNPERLQEIVANGFPQAVLNGLHGGLAEKEATVETLYRWVKADRQDTLQQANAAAAAQASEETRAEKQGAQVASAARSTSVTAEPETEEDRMAAAIGGVLNRTNWRH